MQPAYDNKPEKKSKHEREGKAHASEEESSKAEQVHNALHGSMENLQLDFCTSNVCDCCPSYEGMGCFVLLQSELKSNTSQCCNLY